MTAIGTSRVLNIPAPFKAHANVPMPARRRGRLISRNLAAPVGIRNNGGAVAGIRRVKLATPDAREIKFPKAHQGGYPVQVRRAKINRFRFSENHGFLSSFRAGVRGVSRSSRNVGRKAVDGDEPTTTGRHLRTAKLRGPVAPTLATSPSEAERLRGGDGGNQALVRRGERI